MQGGIDLRAISQTAYGTFVGGQHQIAVFKIRLRQVRVAEVGRVSAAKELLNTPCSSERGPICTTERGLTGVQTGC